MRGRFKTYMDAVRKLIWWPYLCIKRMEHQMALGPNQPSFRRLPVSLFSVKCSGRELTYHSQLQPGSLPSLPPHALMSRIGTTSSFVLRKNQSIQRFYSFFPVARSEGLLTKTIPTYFWPRFRPVISQFSNPGRDKTFSSFSKNVQTGAVPHPALHLIDTDVLSRG